MMARAEKVWHAPSTILFCPPNTPYCLPSESIAHKKRVRYRVHDEAVLRQARKSARQRPIFGAGGSGSTRRTNGFPMNNFLLRTVLVRLDDDCRNKSPDARGGGRVRLHGRRRSCPALPPRPQASAAHSVERGYGGEGGVEKRRHPGGCGGGSGTGGDLLASASEESAPSAVFRCPLDKLLSTLPPNLHPHPTPIIPIFRYQGGQQGFPHLTLASLRSFLEESLACSQSDVGTGGGGSGDSDSRRAVDGDPDVVGSSGAGSGEDNNSRTTQDRSFSNPTPHLPPPSPLPSSTPGGGMFFCLVRSRGGRRCGGGFSNGIGSGRGVDEAEEKLEVGIWWTHSETLFSLVRPSSLSTVSLHEASEASNCSLPAAPFSSPRSCLSPHLARRGRCTYPFLNGNPYLGPNAAARPFPCLQRSLLERWPTRVRFFDSLAEACAAAAATATMAATTPMMGGSAAAGRRGRRAQRNAPAAESALARQSLPSPPSPSTLTPSAEKVAPGGRRAAAGSSSPAPFCQGEEIAAATVAATAAAATVRTAAAPAPAAGAAGAAAAPGQTGRRAACSERVAATAMMTTVIVLGGSHDAGRDGLRLAARGTRLLGIRASDGRLPTVEGRGRSHAIKCTGRDVSVESLRVVAGASTGNYGSNITSSSSNAVTDNGNRYGASSAASTRGSAATATTPPAPGLQAATSGGVTAGEVAPAVARTATATVTTAASTVTRTTASKTAGRAGGDGATAAADGGLARKRGSFGGADSREGTTMKRPRLVFDRKAAQAVMTSKSAAAAAEASGDNTNQKRRRMSKRQAARFVEARRGASPAHAISVEGGSTSISGCEISSFLPCACVCAAGGGTAVRLEHTRLSDGFGMGLLACGKAEASVSHCVFEGMGAAGVEARGGSSVHLSDCAVKECQKSGVFVQAFSRATLRRCDVVGNHFAGAEAMRNACLNMEACNVTNSRRGGVLVHVASKAFLSGCDISGSRLAGVDVRTGAEATLEACSIRGGKASGVYVSAGGTIGISSTLLKSNRLAAVEIQAPPPHEATAISGRNDANEGTDVYNPNRPLAVRSISKNSDRGGGGRGGAGDADADADADVDRDSSVVLRQSVGVPERGGVTAVGCKCCRCCVSLGAGNVATGNGTDSVMRTGMGLVSSPLSVPLSSPAVAAARAPTSTGEQWKG
ncbi:unnamed protein product [Scytosiphon promiscuus]